MSGFVQSWVRDYIAVRAGGDTVRAVPLASKSPHIKYGEISSDLSSADKEKSEHGGLSFAALGRVAKGEGDVIEGWLSYGAALNEGRALFHPEDDKGFGQWVASLHRQLVGVEPNDHERAAAMWAAANPEQSASAPSAALARLWQCKGMRGFWQLEDSHFSLLGQLPTR